MGSLSILVILAVAVLVSGQANYYGQNHQDTNSFPADYLDDIFNRDFSIKPGSTFTFNFEQTRHDQPPQIEMREENVGRYFHHKPQTTTPVPIPVHIEEEPRRVLPNVADMVQYQQPQQQYMQRVPSVPPPPKFAFSKPHNPLQSSHSSPVWNIPTSQNMYPQPPVDNVYHHLPPVEPPQYPFQWPQSQKTVSPSSQLPSSYAKQNQEVKFSPSASYIPNSDISSLYAKQKEEVKFSPSASHMTDPNLSSLYAKQKQDVQFSPSPSHISVPSLSSPYGKEKQEVQYSPLALYVSDSDSSIFHRKENQEIPRPLSPKYGKEKQEIQFSPSASYVSDSIRNTKPKIPPQAPTVAPIRGSHKFNWDDLKNEGQGIKPVMNSQQTRFPQVSQQPSTTQPAATRKQPPPVPTLSPWYDNFGK